MPDTAETVKICGERVLNSVAFPDTRLQTLDRRVGSKKLFFPKEQFEKSVDKWEDIPIVFQRVGIHPNDLKEFALNPAKIAEDIGGKLVGKIANPRILLEGHPNLTASLEIDDNEEEIVKLYREGKLSLSTAFTALSDGDKLISPPIPNHVLLFEETADKAVPGDPGAFVHTIEVEPKMTEGEIEDSKFEAALKRLFYKLMGEPGTVNNALPEANMPDTVPETTTPPNEAKLEAIEKALAEKDAEIKALKEKIDEMTAQVQEVTVLKQRLAEYEKVEAEHKFTQFLHSCVPEGMKATDDMKAELRKQYDADPVALMLSIASKKPTESGVTEKTGDPYMNTEDAKNPTTPTTTVGDLSKTGGN